VLHLILSATVAHVSTAPARPPDGTYTYALVQANGSTIFTSALVVASNGSTFTVSETAKLPNGAVATTMTTWSSATLLPLSYKLQQGTIVVHGTITATSIDFTGTNGSKDLSPLSYTLLPGTKYMLVYGGLNAFRMMLPYVIAAHPNESATVGHINGVQREVAEAGSAAPLPGGPAGDAVSVIALDSSLRKEQLTVYRNMETGAIDEERVSPGDVRMTLVHYVP